MRVMVYWHWFDKPWGIIEPVYGTGAYPVSRGIWVATDMLRTLPWTGWMIVPLSLCGPSNQLKCSGPQWAVLLRIIMFHTMIKWRDYINI